MRHSCAIRRHCLEGHTKQLVCIFTSQMNELGSALDVLIHIRSHLELSDLLAILEQEAVFGLRFCHFISCKIRDLCPIKIT